jgi:hypothetical protein
MLDSDRGQVVTSPRLSDAIGIRVHDNQTKPRLANVLAMPGKIGESYAFALFEDFFGFFRSLSGLINRIWPRIFVRSKARVR